MKPKFLLPVLAMIFAIGMSFTTLTSDADPDMDYVLTNEGVVPIQEVKDCGEGDIQCQGKFSPSGVAFPIYDNETLTIPKYGGGDVIELY